MDFSTMSFQEILFHGRYGIVGAVIFLVFFGTFVIEIINEIRAEVAAKRSMGSAMLGDRLQGDFQLGLTMADGGEPVDGTRKRPEDQQDPGK